jgi:hypothetical protein
MITPRSHANKACSEACHPPGNLGHQRDASKTDAKHLPSSYPTGKFEPVGKLSNFVFQDKWGQPYPAVAEG